VGVWRLPSLERIALFPAHNEIVRAAAFSPDGATLATAGREGRVKLWDLRTGRLTLVLKGHTATVTSLEFSPDGRTLYSSSWDGTTRIWRAATLAEVDGSTGSR
jgi:WD40 repeat protein